MCDVFSRPVSDTFTLLTWPFGARKLKFDVQCICFFSVVLYVYIRSEVNSLSHVRLFATPWTVAYRAPPSVGFSRQEYWSGLPFPSPEDLPNPGIKPGSPALQADALPSEPPGKLR